MLLLVLVLMVISPQLHQPDVRGEPHGEEARGQQRHVAEEQALRAVLCKAKGENGLMLCHEWAC
jgi:hypothetical protein